jgi:selenocysteine lyase/cysteine desulfurase
MHEGVPVAYLDGPGGSQVVDSAITAMTDYLTGGVANLHGAFATSEETDRMLLNARAGAAALLGAGRDEVAFGQNMTSLTFSIASALGRTWRPGDNIVVTELDHRANVDPWLRAARVAVSSPGGYGSTLNASPSILPGLTRSSPTGRDW